VIWGQDPRKAKTLEEAAQNFDGTYNGIRLLAWLSEALHPGKGLSEAECRELVDEVATARRKAVHEASEKA
jgi:hypothetical protein